MLPIALFVACIFVALARQARRVERRRWQRKLDSVREMESRWREES